MLVGATIRCGVAQVRQTAQQLAQDVTREGSPEIPLQVDNDRQPRMVAPDALASETGQDGAPVFRVDDAIEEAPALETVNQLGDVGPAAIEKFRQPPEGNRAAQPDEVIEQFQLREGDIDGPQTLMEEIVGLIGGFANVIHNCWPLSRW